MITEAQILTQRRRPHRGGLVAKGALHRMKKAEAYREQQEQKEQAKRVQVATKDVNNVAEILIEQTEAGGGNFFEFEPGMYEAAIVDVEEVDNPFEDDKTQLQFTFEVPGYENEDGTTAQRRAWANPVWNSKSKLWGWVTAIRGEEPAKGEPFRTSTLVGQKCRIVLNTGKKQDGTTIIKLTDVLGPEKAKAASKAKPGLVSRLKGGDVPAGATVAPDADICSDADCGDEATIYTSRGTPFCDDHAP